MNAPSPFQIPDDGWYQISGLGEYPHAASGLTQIVDEQACQCMVDEFNRGATEPNFAGLLIDFDHFSLDGDKPSEAAGWIVALERRPSGLWAQIRWSDSGQNAVSGGRYRFISPVWNQTECDDLGNSRVRPKRLCNAALTNDPNIKGMMPLSNRSLAPSLPPAPPQPPAPTFVTLDPVHELHLMRGALLANGIYYKTPTLLKNRILTDEQRKAMFAKMGGGGAGARAPTHSAPTSSPQTASSTTSAASDDSASRYDNPPATSPSAADITTGIRPESTAIGEPTRQSSARIEEYKRQIRELESRRTQPPAKPDYEQIDTRKLKLELLKQGKPTNEVFAAMTAAETENRRRRDALRALHSKARQGKAGDPEKQKQALQKLLDAEDKDYQRALAAWQKDTQSIQDKIDRLVAAKNVEEIKAVEELYSSAQKEHLADNKAEEKAARDQTTEKRRQAKEAEAAQKKAEDAARKAAAEAEKARKAAEAQAQKDAKANDPVTAYKTELTKRKLYWQAAARGDWAVAKALYPNADHAANRQELEDLKPKGKSEKEARTALKEMEKLQVLEP